MKARNDGHDGIRQLAVKDMQVRPADAADAHPHPDLVRTRLPVRDIRPFQSRPG
jgi:hypothetical protein